MFVMRPYELRRERLRAARKRGTHTAREWEILKEMFPFCVRCRRSDVVLVKDHITPLYMGGSDSILNLQPLCWSCNSQKGPETIDHRRLIKPDFLFALAIAVSAGGTST